jgi:GNAT superfamily N-acetyltransferase
MTERGREPLFFLEQDNPDDWPRHFMASGFGPLATYYSTLVPDVAGDTPREPNLYPRLAAEGITMRPLDLAHFEEELRRLHGVATAGFAHSFLYAPISLGDFLGLYLPIRPYVRPELVLIAERQDKPVGFVFAIPNLLQAQRGEAVDTVVVKTMAVHPNWAGRGLGTALGVRCQEVAQQLGYRHAIHALMHENNRSRRMSARCNVRDIRRYTLFSRDLQP